MPPRKSTAFPKGRRAEESLEIDLRALFGPGGTARDRLIENLHLIQDRDGAITAAAIAATAAVMRLSQAEVYEVATFYAHFRVLPDGVEAPGAAPVRVCDGIVCKMHGADDLHRQQIAAGKQVTWVPCIGACDRAPALWTGPVDTGSADTEAPAAFPVLQRCLDGSLSREAIFDALDAADLKGLGGAGFPTGRKWRLVASGEGPRYLAVNADEGEPGTFKDRHCLETDPDRVLEGMLIAAWAVGADACYIYLRDEYPDLHRVLAARIAQAAAQGLADPASIHLRRGAGAYICGEETALLESLEGKRGLPRNKPPFPAAVGLFGRPTLINNVETLWWVPEILDKGPETYGGRRLFSVSGRVNRPGVVEAGPGTTVRDLIDRCGGMQTGHAFTAYLPGGASGGLLPASLGNLPLDFGALTDYGCFVGSAAVVVLSDQDSLRDVVMNLMQFFDHESCGQCTPCRVGCEKIVALLGQEKPPLAPLKDLAAVMADASICGLGQAAPNALTCALTHFPEAFT